MAKTDTTESDLLKLAEDENAALKSKIAELERQLEPVPQVEPEDQDYEVTFRNGNLKPSARNLRRRVVKAKNQDEAKRKYIEATESDIMNLNYASKGEILAGFQGTIHSATFDIQKV